MGMRFLTQIWCNALMLCGLFVPLSAEAVSLAPSARYALAAPASRYTIETAGVDRDAELAADATRPKAAPLRYAAARGIAHVARTRLREEGGEWRDLPDGKQLWRVRVHAANARSLDFVFRQFFLPPGSELYVRGATQTLGPYTDADNPRSHVFATPLVHGDSAIIEVLVPRAMRPFLELELETAYAGYRDVFGGKSLRDAAEGSGACNIDTICAQGDAWRREIHAEAALVSGGVYCSGQLINNARGDQTPLIITATHCFATSAAGDTLIVYWKYESPQCRDLGSIENGTPVSSANAIAQTGGADLLAADPDSDVTLFRLRALPPQNANVYFNGWDHTATPFAGGVVTHHPHADAKRISFADGTIVTDDNPSIGDGTHHWHVARYFAGTTEAGSSGAGLLDGNHHLRGVLSNGTADCSMPDGDDYYGRLDSAWQGGGTPTTRIADWLDPQGSGATQIDGLASCSFQVALESSADSLVVGDKVTLNATATGGAPPYRYAFDVDGDGIADTTDPTQSSTPVVYPGAYAGNVSVRVSDANGCVGAATRALIVQAPEIDWAAFPVPAPQTLCGANSNNTVEPGQRRRNILVVVNRGNTPSLAGWAIFAQDPSTLAQTKITLETPAVALPALAPGQAAPLALDYAIDANNACGVQINIDLVGALDARSYSAIDVGVVSMKINSPCQAVTTCPAVTTPLHLTPGAYYDNLRPGTGMTVVTAAQAADPLFFGLWFAGDAAREPTWYQVQAPLHANQVNSPLYQSHQTVPPSWPQRPNAIGTAQVTLVDNDRYAYTWNFNGRSGGGLYQLVTATHSSIRLLYNPAESGWGIYDQFVYVAGSGAPPLLASLLYLYDAAGAPRWVQGNNPAYVAGAPQDVISMRPACPGCVWLDHHAGQQAVGTMRYGGSPNAVQISTNIFLPAPLAGPWQRNALPLTPLYLSP